MQDLARHRVEEGLRAFRLLVVDQQPDVMTLDRLPARLVDPVAAELPLQPRHRLQDAAIIEIDAILRGMRDREPVAGLEMALRDTGAVAKQRVVAIETVQRCLGDRGGVGSGGHVDRTGARGGIERAGCGHGRGAVYKRVYSCPKRPGARRRDAAAAAA